MSRGFLAGSCAVVALAAVLAGQGVARASTVYTLNEANYDSANGLFDLASGGDFAPTFTYDGASNLGTLQIGTTHIIGSSPVTVDKFFNLIADSDSFEMQAPTGATITSITVSDGVTPFIGAVTVPDFPPSPAVVAWGMSGFPTLPADQSVTVSPSSGGNAWSNFRVLLESDGYVPQIGTYDVAIEVTSTAVPLPPSAWLAMAMLPFLGLVHIYRRRMVI